MRMKLGPTFARVSRLKDGKTRMNRSAAKKMKQRSAGKPDIELGKRIRLRRVEQKISQAELGDILIWPERSAQRHRRWRSPVVRHTDALNIRSRGRGPLKRFSAIRMWRPIFFHCPALARGL